MEKKPAAEPAGATVHEIVHRPPPGQPFARDFTDVPRVSDAVRTHSQRISPRKTLPCSVLLKINSTYVMARAIHDVSLVGTYVEIEPADLAIGDFVEAVIEFSDGERSTGLQLNAEVVRIDRHGVGLRFSDYGDQVYTDLVNLLYTR